MARQEDAEGIRSPGTESGSLAGHTGRTLAPEELAGLACHRPCVQLRWLRIPLSCLGRHPGPPGVAEYNTVPGMALTPEQIDAAMATASPDLKFLFDREQVSAEVQAKFYHYGITTMRQFGAAAETAEDMRSCLKKDFELDPGDGMAKRVMVSKVMVAWESAKIRSAKLSEAEAESELRQEAKPIRTTDYGAMLKNYEEKWGGLDKEDVPAKVYVERISDGVEKAEPRAEPLTEVINKLEGETDILKAVWDPQGSIKAVRTAPTVALPRDPEELRARVALLGRAWAFVAAVQPNCSYLQGVKPQHWADYLKYLLGPTVCKLHARDEHGNIVASPPWNLVLSYELEIRRRMVDLMVRGKPMAEALKEACDDPVVKERCAGKEGQRD